MPQPPEDMKQQLGEWKCQEAHWDRGIGLTPCHRTATRHVTTERKGLPSKVALLCGPHAGAKVRLAKKYPYNVTSRPWTKKVDHA